jgi:hypothetical protein
MHNHGRYFDVVIALSLCGPSSSDRDGHARSVHASEVTARNSVPDPPRAACRLVADAVEKGIFRNLEATLIQDRKPTRNLDSKIHMAGFVRFKF